ncbi:hypothetical protein BAE44_0006182 [Dichanthelium oligosanthes]|uniref:Uncharacterized protein n=1 Tax=Dichanthelium oligosanthes TaxID=888268 RepID=A0A1E5W603_9POAL|nr:hypothetical protein BAE44_0006182 [Dichanthelium oligosanthes]
MSTLVATIVLLLLLVVVGSPVAVTAVAGERRRPPSLVPFRPKLGGQRQPFFHGRAAGGCMPRGFRVPPSAPSRYVNYHTLDAGVCGHGGGRKP